jgi:hypothetical protein
MKIVVDADTDVAAGGPVLSHTPHACASRMHMHTHTHTYGTQACNTWCQCFQHTRNPEISATVVEMGYSAGTG